MAIIDSRRGASAAELYEYKRKSWTEEEKKEKDKLLTKAEKEALPYMWEFWARPNQLLPPKEVVWQTWLIIAGRGFGKTRTGAESIRQWNKQGINYCNIIAATADDARDVCIEGESGVLNICTKAERPDYLASKRQLQWPNGAVSLIFTADEPERLRGKQHCKLWCDELAAWRYLKEAWTQAMLGLRLGANPQSVVTTTPRPLKEIKELIESPTTYLTRGTTYENKRNLAEAFYSRIIIKYEGTRLGRQELDAEILEDRPGALWHATNIDDTRCDSEKFSREVFPNLLRVVGGIDPAASSDIESSDETGIIFCGVDDKPVPHFYVFDDRSDIYSPDGWAQEAIKGYRIHKADRLIGEKNNGGEMVEATLRHADPNVSYKGVHASKGKTTRAEPIAALYEQKRVHHVGSLTKLEDQMCDYEPGITDDSPDRMDALVWAMTELSESSGQLGLVEYMKSGQAAEELKAKPGGGSVVVTGRRQQKEPPADAGQTNNCPACGAGPVAFISGGQKRCMECGHQYYPGAAPAGPLQATRQQMLERGAAVSSHGRLR